MALTTTETITTVNGVLTCTCGYWSYASAHRVRSHAVSHDGAAVWFIEGDSRLLVRVDRSWKVEGDCLTGSASLSYPAAEKEGPQ